MLAVIGLLQLLFNAAAFASELEGDPRVISYEDLMMSGSLFSEPGVTSYTQMLFDISRNQVIVGARDNLFRLSLDLDKLERAPWLAPADKVKLCQDKGQTEEDCHNYVKVLLSNGKKLFTCGTNAFSPQCSLREMEEVNRVIQWVRGVAQCPYNPHANVTSLLSVTKGTYFAATPVDFSGADPAIVRCDMGKDPHDPSSGYLRTNQYNSNWLNEPQFVGSFETEDHVYFLFRESAVEYINCGKAIYSRIARVCKNDNGGQVMLRDNWTTFVKARLNCSIPGEYPFYYDNIQGMSYLPDQGLLYATFTTPENSIPGSAICSFNLTSIEAAFNGPFKHQASAGSAWERKTVRTTHASCSGSQTVLDSKKYQLMDLAVQPTSMEPLYHSRMETLTHIAVDTVPTKLHKTVHVLYVSTAEGVIKKISVLERTQKTCTLEVWKPIPTKSPANKIYMLQLAAGSLYASTEEAVVKVAKQHCKRYKTRASCIAAMDPHCGWNEHKEMCTPPPDDNPLSAAWHQDARSCPIFDQPVDGGWSAWSPYATCEQANGDGCLCSTRTCDNPAPHRGGATCPGTSVRVTNCTVHGGWTAWSVWSACSQTCGMAVKTRRRVCGNPAPQYGGRVCVGQDRSEMYCHSNPPCPIVTNPVRDGGWTSWSSWGECSAKCGGGFRVRTRSCTNPPPQQPGGLDCPGCHIEYQVCNTAACIESKRLSSWTQWTPFGNGSERRMRFSCRAPVSDPSLIKVALFKVDDRFCQAEGICTKSERGEGEDLWSEWTAWSPCSAECGTGQQTRSRTCDGGPGDCHGQPTATRACNTHHCKGEWDCWTDWSSCSASCGLGTRTRLRSCIGGDRSTCQGPSTMTEECHVSACLSLAGWDDWTRWSSCDAMGQQSRTRSCMIVNPTSELCQGPDTDVRFCADAISEETVAAGMGVGTAIGCLVIGFLIGTVASLTLRHVIDRRAHNRLPASPHYISSKQNPYVTVPLKDTPQASPKRTPSFNRQLSNGTARLFKGGGSSTSGNGLPPGDYDTATIKRNSHSLVNGHIRADLNEQDKFF